MDLLTTILLAAIGSSGFFAFLQYLISRKDNKSTNLKEIETSLAHCATRIEKNELADAQTHILILINHYPTEHTAIKAELEYYFGVLHGDSWVWEIANKWADREGVDISYLEQVHIMNVQKGTCYGNN